MDFSVTRGEFIIRRQHEKFFKLLLKTHTHTAYTITHTHTLSLSLSLLRLALCLHIFFSNGNCIVHSQSAYGCCRRSTPSSPRSPCVFPSPPRSLWQRLHAVHQFAMRQNKQCTQQEQQGVQGVWARELGRGDCTGYTYKCCAYDKSLCHFYYFMRL